MKQNDAFNFDYSTFGYEDMGLFTGLISMPLDLDKLVNYYENEIEQNLFDAYRKALWENLSKSKSAVVPNEKEAYNKAMLQYTNAFYMPKAYCMLGRWDLMIMSICDDFEFSVRTFKSHSTISRSDSEQHPVQSNFSYQINTGISPTIDTLNKTDKRVQTLYEMWEELNFPTLRNGYGKNRPHYNNYLQFAKKLMPGFKTQRKPIAPTPPLLGICALKINNALLIGNKEELYKRIVGEVFNEIQKTKGLSSILVETTSWNEIQVMLFGNNYVDIANCVNDIKNIRLIDICGGHKPTAKNILHNSILGVKNNDCIDSHIFSKAIVNFGFDFEIMRGFNALCKKKPLSTIDIDAFLKSYGIDEKNKTIAFTQGWFIKPGHIDDVKKMLKKAGLVSDNASNLVYANADYSFKKRNCSSYGLVKHILQCHIVPEITNYIYQTFTIPEVKITKKNNKQAKHHQFFHSNLNQLQFSRKEILDVSRDLKTLGISKVTAEKITNIYANFNDNVSDSIMYIYFLELWPLLYSIKETLTEYVLIYNKEQQGDKNKPIVPRYNLKSLQAALEKFSEDYLNAHGNRYLQGHSMNELADHNFYFKGGIHQLVSTIDNIYKIIASLNGHDSSIATITASQRVESSENAVKLNLFHIYQPEVFFAIAVREAVNHVFNSFIAPQNTTDSTGADVVSSAFYKLKILKADLANNFNLTAVNINIPAQLNIDSEVFNGEEVAQYLIVDWLVFLSTYGQDYKLFARLHWYYMLQQPETYIAPGVAEEFNVDSMYLRLKLIYEINKTLAGVTMAGKFEVPDEEILNRVLTTKRKKFLDSVIKNYLLTAEVTVIINDIYTTCLAPIIGTRRAEAEDIDAVNDDFSQILEGKLIADFNLFDFRKLYACNDINTINKDLENSFSGFVMRFTKLVNDYIKYILGNGKRKSLLTRERTGKVKIHARGYENILFDTRGGMFVTLPHVRRQHLKMSTAMLRSFWMVGNQLKAVWACRMINDDFKNISYPNRAAHITRKDRNVFLSHTSGTSAMFNQISNEIFKQLLAEDINPFIFNYNDRNGRYKLLNNPGPINYVTRSEITKADLVILEISNRSLSSPYCIAEINAAIKAFKLSSEKILFVLVSGTGTEPDKDIVNCLFTHGFEEARKSVVKQLKEELSKRYDHHDINLWDAEEFLKVKNKTNKTALDEMFDYLRASSNFKTNNVQFIGKNPLTIVNINNNAETNKAAFYDTIMSRLLPKKHIQRRGHGLK